MSQKEVAEILNITQSAYSQIEGGGVSLTVSHLKRLSNLFSVSMDWMAKGKTDDGDGMKKEESIPLIDIEAKAGYSNNYDSQDFLDELERFKVPGFKDGEHRIFEVEGKSMIPTLFPNDYVICQPLDDFEKLVDNTLAVVVSEDSVVVKRLAANGEDGKLICHSDNPDFRSYYLDKSEISEIWPVDGKVTKSFNGENTNLEKRISGLEVQLEKLVTELKRKIPELNGK